MLKPNTVYYYQAPDDSTGGIDVQCPPAKQHKTEKAFMSYITISTGNDGSTFFVIDATSGFALGLLLSVPQEGFGSMLTITCVNGPITAAYNEARNLF